METSELLPEEYDAAVRLWLIAFDRGSRSSQAAWRHELETACHRATTLAVRSGGRLAGCVVVIHFKTEFGTGMPLPMGGIAAVATDPASRGQGTAAAGLRAALALMRERGESISALYPFSWAFYRSLGWEWVGETRRYSVPAALLPRGPESASVVRLTEADWEEIDGLYREFARRYRGMLVRDRDYWARLLSDTDSQFVITAGVREEGRLCGYLTLRGGSRDETFVREMVAITPQARMALLGYLKRMDMQTNRFAWEAPGNDRFWNFDFATGTETSVRPTTQGRIVDVERAFSSLSAPSDVRTGVRIEVVDEQADWNTGTWQIDAEGGRVAVRRTDQAPQIRVPIQGLAQIYWSTPGAEAVREAGKMVVLDEAAFASLKAIVAGPPAWLNDAF